MVGLGRSRGCAPPTGVTTGSTSRWRSASGSSSSRRCSRRGRAGTSSSASRPGPPPPGATRKAWWRIAVRAAYPSTIGLAVLIAIAGPLEPTLAAALAGAELGLGGMSLVLGIENGYWERGAGVVVEYQSGMPPRFYARRRGH